MAVPDLWAAWTSPEGVASFWSEEADVAPAVGGPYVLGWPSRGWVLRGVVLAVHPGRSITFTWAWDHEPDRPERTVTLSMDSTTSGSRLVVVQGPYGEGPDEAEDRAGHEAGWRWFADRLRARP